jgi:hypothetical protein
MKKISLLLMAAALLISGNAMANDLPIDPVKDPGSKICIQIADLLEKNRFELQNEAELTAFVSFILNSDKEIVVLSVDTESAQLEGFVKARLNYHKVADQNIREGKIYQIPIRIKA